MLIGYMRVSSADRQHTHLQRDALIAAGVAPHHIFVDHATNMLFFKIEKEYWNTMITFLVFLNRMPEHVDTTDVDESCLKLLKLL